MRKDIEQCGRAIYDMEFPWGIVSNGLLMTPKKIDGLLRAGLHSATISLDGFQDDHEWMRGIQGSFRNASEAIRILANEPSIKFDVVTCVNNRNYEKLADFKEYLIALGLKSWRLFTVFPVGRAAQDPELQLSNERFRGLMEFIKSTRKEGRIKASYGCEVSSSLPQTNWLHSRGSSCTRAFLAVGWRMAVSVLSPAMIIDRNTQSWPSTAIIPWGVEEL